MIRQGRIAQTLHSSKLQLVGLLSLLAAALLMVAAATPASAKYSWKMGTPTYEITGYDCIFGTPVTLIGGTAGAQVDRKQRKPKVGDVFYVRLDVGNAGSKCGAGEAMYASVALPKGVKVVTSKKRQARCYYRTPTMKKWERLKGKNGACVTRFGKSNALHRMVGKWYSLNLPGKDPWIVPQGMEQRFELPVKSSRAISAAKHSGGCACLVASLVTTSGNSEPEGSWRFKQWAPPAHGPWGPITVYSKAKKKR